jgi:hypothetical protein
MFSIQKLKRYWQKPFRYEPEGTMIVDANGARILDVRGWGHLTGKGSHGVNEKFAAEIQDEIGRDVAAFLNTEWP